jgi:hypothetical protein
MNDNDKAGRYLFKRDPAGHLRWLLANPALEFHAWIDSRRVVLPNQKDLTQDLVAAVRSGDVREAFCLELEAEAQADALRRLLAFCPDAGSLHDFFSAPVCTSPFPSSWGLSPSARFH